MKPTIPRIAITCIAAVTTAMFCTYALAKPATTHGKAAKPSKKTAATKATPAPLWVAQPEEIQQIARWVDAGVYDCFDHQTVTITKRLDYLGYVDLQAKGKTYRTLPVVSNTGAVRLESKTDGVYWLQLSAKSMLFNARTGSRMIDDCQPRNPAPVVTNPTVEVGLDIKPVDLKPLESKPETIMPAPAINLSTVAPALNAMPQPAVINSAK
jgi:hypothetical protein